jgi:putative tryptophan/tyrosine transport system substrate-binding protein
MRRRDFVKGITGSVAVWPLTARAQQSSSVPKIGFLTDESQSLGSTALKVLATALSERGYTEGRNIVIESRYANENYDLLPGLAAELVRMHVNVIFSVGTPATRAAKNATDALPIVFSRIADPIALGLVSSLARPGGNLTGVCLLTSDLSTKWLELLTEAVPGLKRVGVLWESNFPPASLEVKQVERAAPLLKIELEKLGVQNAEELEPTVRSLSERHAQALIVVPSLLFYEQRKSIADIAIKYGLPTMLGRKENVEAGGLMSYGPNYSDMYRRAATYVDKILKGANPRELPVEQPTAIELIINLKTAKSLGITVSRDFLLLADDLIQ